MSYRIGERPWRSSGQPTPTIVVSVSFSFFSYHPSFSFFLIAVVDAPQGPTKCGVIGERCIVVSMTPITHSKYILHILPNKQFNSVLIKIGKDQILQVRITIGQPVVGMLAVTSTKES